MFTKAQIYDFLEADIKAVNTPPPIDDFIGYYKRRISIEFNRHSNRLFRDIIWVERPFHHEDVKDERGETNEVKTYDQWDEDTWVERGKKELLDRYTDILENAQYHLKAIEEKNHE